MGKKRQRVSFAAYVALLPMALTVLLAYLGTMLWTARVSVSSSRTFPASDFVGASQYIRLFNNERWLLSLQNVAVYGVLFIALCLAIGFLLAVFIDQKVMAEGALRTVFLYPYAMSFVATGLIWQWILNPELGIQEVLHKLGWTNARFDWIVDQDMAIYTIVIATVWQASGLVMALMLSGLRGVDEEIWKAARIDGIPRWRVYLSIVLPMLGLRYPPPSLLFVMVVKVFDAWSR
jgi:glucose/mannose transport system permease protein